MTGTDHPENLPRSASPVYISEYRTADGWLELHNPADSTVPLDRFRLFIDHRYQDFDRSDMAPREYRLIKGADRLKKAILVYLLDAEGNLVDLLDEPRQEERKSMIRTPGADGAFFEQAVERWTPGFSNDEKGDRAYQAGRRRNTLPGVLFSEISASGKDEYVELCNMGDAAADLGGFGLSDDENTPGYIFPEGSILKPGQYLAVYPPFGIKNGEDHIYLSDREGFIVREYGPVSMPKKHSLVSVNRAPFIVSATLSPGEPNVGEGMAPAASIASGQYDGVDTLKLELYAKGDIRYTTDGSEPGKASARYRGAISLTGTTVIRAVAFGEDGKAGPVASYTYIINEGHSLDVVSLVSNPDGLFSTATGIYSDGPFRLKPEGTEDDGTPGINYPYVEANYWRRWWRKANVSLLPREGAGFSYDCGTSIFGGFSRIHPKKSMKFKFSKDYGPSKLYYKLFPQRDFCKYNNFVMRAGGQDDTGTLIKDDLVSALADTVLDVMASRPAVFYINGRYYGIYFIREKINKHFIASHYGIPADSLDIIQGYSTCEEGSVWEFSRLISFVKTHDLSKAENYSYVCDRVDVQNFADWVIAEIWTGNMDPGNVRCFRSRHLDNKWRWILYDTDMGLNSPTSKSFLDFLTPTDKDFRQTDLIRGLLKNKDFRELFLSRLEFQMKNVWNAQRVNSFIDRFEEALDPEIPRNQKRWTGSYEGWKARIAKLHAYADGRQAFLKRQFGSDPFLKTLLHMSSGELDTCFGY